MSRQSIKEWITFNFAHLSTDLTTHNSYPNIFSFQKRLSLNLMALNRHYFHELTLPTYLNNLASYWSDTSQPTIAANWLQWHWEQHHIFLLGYNSLFQASADRPACRSSRSKRHTWRATYWLFCISLSFVQTSESSSRIQLTFALDSNLTLASQCILDHFPQRSLLALIWEISALRSYLLELTPLTMSIDRLRSGSSCAKLDES